MKEVIKKRAKSKTYNLATLTIALGAVQMYLPQITEQLGSYAGMVTMAVGVAVAVLRERTTTALRDK